ncbi:hypothetical protein [Chryseobacterium sp. CT-SW4]|uniref:hypothetical protein n=1 Tax=Chryseobacterium sp. SW-1 TaxID=3157343 RepID=UPI003B02669A
MKSVLLLIGFCCSVFLFAQKNQSYLSIGYTSICCGTPSEEPVINYIKQFQKKNRLKEFEVLIQRGLGREGEFELYIGVDQLSKAQKSRFINGLQATLTTQNSQRKPNKDGFVNFDEAQVLTSKDLSDFKNLTIYKNLKEEK